MLKNGKVIIGKRGVVNKEEPATKELSFRDVRNKLKDNEFVSKLPAELQERVKSLFLGCNCNITTRIKELLPELKGYL
jgi:uncharacterized protein YaiI (UPF0178 family)